MFSNLKIQTKLLVMIGLVMMLGVVISGWSLLTIIRLDALSTELAQHDQAGSDILTARNVAARIALADLSYALSLDDRYLYDHVGQRAVLETYLTRAELRSAAPLPQIDEHLAALDANWVEFYNIVGTSDDFEPGDRLAMANADLMTQVTTETDTLYESISDDLAAVQSAADAAYYSSLIIGGLALILFLILSLVVAITLTRAINQPMVALIDAARAMERGEFDPAMVERLTGRTDEIGSIARSLIDMARDVEARRVALTAEAAELRAKLADSR